MCTFCLLSAHVTCGHMMEMEPQGRDLAFLYSDNKLTDQKELLER